MVPFVQNMDQLRYYSSMFSRRTLNNIIEYDDYSVVNSAILCLDKLTQWNGKTYLEYFAYMYDILKNNYQCEYIYKNEILSGLLYDAFSHKDTVAFSEFHVNQSIADLVLFNSTSRVYEIKTEYDSDKRLAHQLVDYCKLFELCYLVTSIEKVEYYRDMLPEQVGIITINFRKQTPVFSTLKKATTNQNIDIDTLMQSVRTAEYMNITKHVCGRVPDVSIFDMYDACREKLYMADNAKVNLAFKKEIKKRKSSAPFIPKYEKCLRQMCLAINMQPNLYNILYEKLNHKIYI